MILLETCFNEFYITKLNISIHENAFDNVIRKLVAILYWHVRLQLVTDLLFYNQNVAASCKLCGRWFFENIPTIWYLGSSICTLRTAKNYQAKVMQHMIQYLKLWTYTGACILYFQYLRCSNKLSLSLLYFYGFMDLKWNGSYFW